MPRAYVIYTDEEIDFVRYNYPNMTLEDIAEYLGVSRSKVKGIVTRYGFSGGRKKYSPEVRTFRAKFNSYKHNAIARGYEFKLTFEEFVELTSQNCYYCNKQPTLLSPKQKVTKKCPKVGDIRYNGIDRYYNDLGYGLENCVTCCINCNEMKMDKTPEEFFEGVKNIYEKHINKGKDYGTRELNESGVSKQSKRNGREVKRS